MGGAYRARRLADTSRGNPGSLTVICRPIRATLKRRGSEATLGWTNGEAPFTVQQATALDAFSWTDVLSNAVAPVVLPLADTQGFYRIVGK